MGRYKSTIHLLLTFLSNYSKYKTRIRTVIDCSENPKLPKCGMKAAFILFESKPFQVQDRYWELYLLPD